MERLENAASLSFVNLKRKFLVGLVACALALPLPIVTHAQGGMVPYNGAAQRNDWNPWQSINVTTYHSDPQRTGWNPWERILTPSNVTQTTFGLITSVPLDEKVDAQPLVVAHQFIKGQGIHNVVYVATENNSVYAIDGSTGDILRTANFGAPVPSRLGCCCGDILNAGISSTPTIDVWKQTIYVMVYTFVAGQPIYELHALNLQTLRDRPGSPVTVSGSHSLADGSEFDFNAAAQRQRPALLESNGNIYVGFGSFCDIPAESSRGWVLGWNAGTLTPLESNSGSGNFCDPGWFIGWNFGILTPLCANEVTNTLATAPWKNGKNFFLSSIWMSGYGLAADWLGHVYFVTANSDPTVNTYTGTTNIQESVVQVPADLNGLVDLFTPSNVFTLDQTDWDYGSGGVMVLPDQPGPTPHLAVAAGKDGRLFILNRDNMGRLHNPDIPANVQIGMCWCGPSYFQGSDGIGRVVSSGGISTETWTISTSQRPALTLEASSDPVLWTIPYETPSFFTTVSSNGRLPNTAIIWAVRRPIGPDYHITLYAFNATKVAGSTSLSQLWSGSAGFWPNLHINANIVPTVANGKVYVASSDELAIFGLTSPVAQTEAKLAQADPSVNPPGALFWGAVKSIHDSRVVLLLRTGELLQVDLSEAFAEGTTIAPVVGENVVVNGQLDEEGVLQARVMWSG